ncbi:hypothetical protein C8J37_10988 [Rhizobium sp. PP-WC-1G-195]|nr:hypothetical protein C8J37_10988 [Rhizobium sp. PP-WC-1G-195]
MQFIKALVALRCRQEINQHMARDVLTVQQISGPSTDHVANRLKFILAEVKLLAAEYYQLTGKPLGVTGEIAEYVASEILKLELVPPRTPGYDALRRFADGTYERVQIKGRAFDPAIAGSQRMGKIKSEGPCDVVMLVLLHSATLDPIEIWEAPFAAVVVRLAEPGSRSRNERGALAVSDFKRLGIMVWSGERGGPQMQSDNFQF